MLLRIRRAGGGGQHRVVELVVEPSDTIDNLKAMIWAAGVPADQLEGRLFLGSQQLVQGDMTLLDAGFVDGCIVEVRPSVVVLFRRRGADGEAAPPTRIICDPTDTVDAIQRRIHREHGVEIIDLQFVVEV